MVEQTDIIALVNQKGGCGKTTSAVSLAAGLTQEGYSVCLVDNDPQCNTSETFFPSAEDLERIEHFSIVDIYGARRPASELPMNLGPRFENRLALIASSPGATATQQRLAAELHATLAGDELSDLDEDDLRDEQRQRLKTSLDSLRGIFDFVIIDTPPELGFLMTSALIAADWYVIPVFPGRYDLRGLETLERNVQSVQRRHNTRLRLLGVLLGNYQAGVSLDAGVKTMLEQKYGEYLLPVIHRSVRHREAAFHGKTIFEHPGAGLAAEQYLAASREIITRIGQSHDATLRSRAAAAGGGETGQGAEAKEVNRG